MVSKLTSYEARTHRPFKVDPLLDILFNNAVLHVDKHKCRPNQTVAIDPDPFLTASIDVEWAPDEAEFRKFRANLRQGIVQTGLAPELTTLVISARTPYLKTTNCLYTLKVGDLRKLKRVTNLGTQAARAEALKASLNGCEITATLVLNQGLEVDEPMRPRDRAYWLSRATFKVASLKHWPLWQPQMLTDEQRERLGLDPGTVSYVEMGDDSDVIAPLGECTPVLWIDQDIWAELAAPSHKEAAEAFGWQLAMTLIRETLFRYATHSATLQTPPSPDTEREILRNSLIGRLISAIDGQQASESIRLDRLAQARQDPGLVAALAEDAFKIKESILEGLRES